MIFVVEAVINIIVVAGVVEAAAVVVVDVVIVVVVSAVVVVVNEVEVTTLDVFGGTVVPHISMSALKKDQVTAKH